MKAYPAEPFQSLKIDSHSSLPVYIQIATALSKLVKDRTLPPGYPLPPERVLCDQFGVSRMTLRQAIGLLEREGLILSHRGRGTFVAHDLIRKQQQELRGFTEEILARGGVPESRLLSFELAPPPEEARLFFGLSQEDKVYEIKRIRLSDKVPLAFETVLLSQRLYPRLEQFDLARNSLYRILEESYNVRIEACVEEISARQPTAEHRKLLELPRNAAVLVIRRKTYTDLGQPLEFTSSAYRGDLYSAMVHSIRKRPIGEQ